MGVCVKCRESGCNDVPRVRPSELSCIRCKKTEACAFGHPMKSAVACKTDVRLGCQESCFTRHNAG